MKKNKRISSKTWCVLFVCALMIVLSFITIINYVVDPIGVFGDRFLNWFSYDFTNNPRAAKIAYLDKHNNEYNSYIIGCSSTSSYPTELLNKYFEGKFYNMIMYGADMFDVEKECNYLLNNYEVKNLIINIYMLNGEIYNWETDSITGNLHANVDGSSKFLFYSKYLFLDPRYALKKVDCYMHDTYLTQPFDVFRVSDGVYDKKVRDAEPIGNLYQYYEAYPVFKEYPQWKYDMKEIDSCIESIKNIKNMCEQRNVNLIFTTSPMYEKNIEYFSRDGINKFFTELANVTPFWDFTYSSISKDPRYFYDATHFRNDVGRMAVARMFEDNSIYYPDDFGTFVTKDNVYEHLITYFDVESNYDDYTTKLPVLLYHHIDYDTNSTEAISPKRFEQHMQAIYEAGFTPISLNQLYDYVEKGINLPERSIMITFDDGYYSNYEYGFPVLQRYNFNAIIFAIGSSVGHKKYYKDTEYECIPHFSYDEAKKMEQSGLISIESHTYDLHQWGPFETGEVRDNVLKHDSDSEEEIIDILRKDFTKYNDEFKKYLGKSITAIAFPHGDYETLTHVILREEGVVATFGTVEANNTIIKGIKQSLLGLNRYNMTEHTTANELIQLLNSK